MTMQCLKVGIAYEGGDDGEIIAAIVRRVLSSSGYTFDEFSPETPGTAILGYISAYTRRFMSAGVDIGIFCTDQDKSLVSRRKDIQDKIRRVDELFLRKAAVGVPCPHIEAWLLIQDSVVKNILGIDGAKSLPHSELPPKDRLTALYSESDMYEKTPKELRVEIAQNLDINICCRQNTDFNAFVQDLRTIITNRNDK